MPSTISYPQRDTIEFLIAKRQKKYEIHFLLHMREKLVKKVRINMLIHEYEQFTMKENKTISKMHSRLTDIISSLKNLGHEIDLESKNWKMIRLLSLSW